MRWNKERNNSNNYEKDNNTYYDQPYDSHGSLIELRTSHGKENLFPSESPYGQRINDHSPGSQNSYLSPTIVYMRAFKSNFSQSIIERS